MRRIILFVVVIAISGSAYIFGWTNIFKVSSVEINYESELGRERFAATLDIPSLINKPIARIDRRELSKSVARLTWIDHIEVSRNLISGKVAISVVPKVALAGLDPKWSTSPGLVPLLSEDLAIIYVDKDAVALLEKSPLLTGTEGLPRLELGRDDSALKRVVPELLKSLSSWQVNEIRAPEIGNLSSSIRQGGRNLEVYWGDINEIGLKVKVLERLLALKENQQATDFDLSNPLSPISK